MVCITVSGEGSSSVAKGQVLWRRVKFEVLSSVAKGQLKFCGEGSRSVAKGQV